MVEKLTENNRQKFCSFDEFVLHLISNFRNFGMTFLINEPTEQVVFFHQITFVNVWDATFKEHLLQKKKNFILVEVNFEKSSISIFNLQWLGSRQCPILRLLCHRQFSQRQYRSGHIHRRCSPIQRALFAISFDLCRLQWRLE